MIKGIISMVETDEVNRLDTQSDCDCDSCDGSTCEGGMCDQEG